MTNLDGLKWVMCSGVEWTIANRVTADRNHYSNHKKNIVGGVELCLEGKLLSEYKAAYKAAHGENLKCPKLVVIDRERLLAYEAYCLGLTQSRDVDSHTAVRVDGTATSSKEDGALSITSDREGVAGESVPDKEVLQELIKITQDKGLHWVKYGNGIFLPMVEACKAKDMEKDDYSSNWQGGQLPGVGMLLEGAALQAFKTLYIKDHGAWPFYKTRSLRIGNWEHVYAYLVQGKSPTATTFQTMGAKSIQQSVIRSTVTAPLCPESWASEEGLVDRVFKLMELSCISMQREACFFNTLGNTPTTRRVDAIEHIPGEDGGPSKVHVYEFKKHLITASHVTETVGTKGYVHLVRERYPDAKVCLFMVGNQIDPNAQRLLDCMLGVMYLPLSTLLNRILSSIVNSWPREGYYQLRTHFLSQFQDILPPEMLSGPIDHPQIIATYHKPTTRVLGDPRVADPV